jgi:hypothetical protein
MDQSILTGRVSLSRLTPYVLDERALAASLDIDRQPARQCRLEVTVSGATYSAAGGTVTIGAEAFAFTEDATAIGTSDHAAIAGAVSIDGISDGFISVRAVSRTGQAVSREETIDADVPCRFYAQSGRIRMMKAGNSKVAEYKVMLEPDRDIREFDFISPVSNVYGIEKGQVSFVSHIMDFAGLTHHVEAEVLRIK